MDQVRLEASGLWLDPNELTTPAGAMREALNVRIRRANIIEPRPGFPLTEVTGASGGGWQIFSWSGETYAVFGGELWHIDGTPAEVTAAGSSLDITSSESFGEAMGRCFYVTTDDGVYRIATPGAVTAVLAGIPAAAVPLITAITGSGVANGEHVAMRVLFADTVNEQLLLGAPSESSTYANASGSTKGVSLQVPLPGWLSAGMSVQVYRTDVVAVATPTGDEMALARSQVILAGDVTAGYVTVTLLTDAAEVLGASLYTNETQEGILQAAYPPPKAKAIAWWKQMAFYGDTSALDEYVLTGEASATALSSGVGSIGGQFIGDTTLGSPIITSLPGAHGIQVGCYVTEGGVVSVAGTSIPADARIIASGATTITLDRNASATTVGVTFDALEVLDVAGVSFINGAISDIAGLQFGSRQDLVALVASYTNVTLDVSSYTAQAYTLTWRSVLAFDIGYQSAAAGGTLEGLYGATPTSATTEDTIPSRVMWSKTLQPEAVPLLQYQDIGDWRAPVMRMIATRDSLFVLKADGAWRITGDGPDSLRFEEFDRSLKIVHRRCADAHDNRVWAWTTRGVVAITEAGPEFMSEPSIREAIEASQANVAANPTVGGAFITGCDTQGCVLVGVPAANASGASAAAEYVYCYESNTGAWVRWAPLTNVEWRGGVEHDGLITLVGDTNSTMTQDDDRTDAESAVTVTLAEATQATVGALGATGVGHRITQGATVAWLTESLGSAAYTTTATLVNGAATTAFPMTCEVEWCAPATSGALAHWRQLRAQFSTIVQVWRVVFGFSSERVHTESTVYHDYTDPTADAGVSALRVFVTRAQSRAARLRPLMRIISAGQLWTLEGLTLTGEPMRDGNRLP
jgi:hypothetical protein